MFRKTFLFLLRLYVTFFVTIFMQCSAETDAIENIKRQNLIPSARIGREIFITGEDVPIELHSSLEESVEFSNSEPDYIDSEVFLSSESDSDDNSVETTNEPIVDRKKRSLSQQQHLEDTTQKQKEPESKWNTGTESDFFKTEKRRSRSRNKVVFIPRIGKKTSGDDGIYGNKRVVFIPRIGKKSLGDFDFSEDKRAIFIPRIGKRSYANLYNPDAKKAVFIPRIGRGAYLPKVIRYNPQYKVNGRIVFIPRIG